VEHPLGRDISHIKVTALVAVVVLIGIGAWELVSAFEQKDASGTFVAASTEGSGAQNSAIASTSSSVLNTSDPIAEVSNDALGEVVGAYTGLQENGEYSSTTAANVAGTIGLGLAAPVSYTPLSASQIPTSPNTSYAAMMSYRAALQTSLKPLLNNAQPEYLLFGEYVQTKDPTYLTQLETAASNYRAAASSTALIVVPEDAVQVQLGIVNSLNEFAATLDALTSHADDPIASSVLLENYNNAETDVLTAFQNLVTYEQSKTQ
jgi:hypothetical protein